jgi:hypothetical protein
MGRGMPGAAADPAGADDSFRPSVGAGASFATNVPATAAIAWAWLAFLRGDAEEMAGFAAQVRARLRGREWMLASICLLNAALADWLRGRLGTAEQHLTAAIAEWQAAGQHALAAQGCHYLRRWPPAWPLWPGFGRRGGDPPGPAGHG